MQRTSLDGAATVGSVAPRSHRDQILAELSNVPMFQEIIEIDTLVMIASKCVLKRYEEGEHIVVQGYAGDSMYVVKSGRVSVTQSCNTHSVVERQGPAHIELAQLGPKVKVCLTHSHRSHDRHAAHPFLRLSKTHFQCRRTYLVKCRF